MPKAGHGPKRSYPIRRTTVPTPLATKSTMIQNPKLTIKPSLPDTAKLAEMTAEQITPMPAWKIDLKVEADGAFLGELSALLKRHEQAQQQS